MCYGRIVEPAKEIEGAPEGGEIGMRGCDARERLQSDYRAAAEQIEALTATVQKVSEQIALSKPAP